MLGGQARPGPHVGDHSCAASDSATQPMSLTTLLHSSIPPFLFQGNERPFVAQNAYFRPLAGHLDGGRSVA